MDAEHAQFIPSPREARNASSFGEIPWQIWAVVAFLAVEGILGNLPAIPQNPIAVTWLAAKCLFVVGLLRRWRWVFVLYLVIGVIHVLAFAMQAPFIAFLNLVLVFLTASAIRFYFPKTSTSVE